jgi:hypothetical protein
MAHYLGGGNGENKYLANSFNDYKEYTIIRRKVKVFLSCNRPSTS